MKRNSIKLLMLTLCITCIFGCKKDKNDPAPTVTLKPKCKITSYEDHNFVYKEDGMLDYIEAKNQYGGKKYFIDYDEEGRVSRYYYKDGYTSLLPKTPGASEQGYVTILQRKGFKFIYGDKEIKIEKYGISVPEYIGGETRDVYTPYGKFTLNDKGQIAQRFGRKYNLSSEEELFSTYEYDGNGNLIKIKYSAGGTPTVFSDYDDKINPFYNHKNLKNLTLISQVGDFMNMGVFFSKNICGKYSGPDTGGVELVFKKDYDDKGNLTFMRNDYEGGYSFSYIFKYDCGQ